jgi:hypothetical protein
MQEYEFHDVANFWPLMEGKDFDDLVESVRREGQLIDIELWEDKIIDGRNRYRACEKLGFEPQFAEVDLTGRDVVSYVHALNGDRRHMTPSQLAMVGEKAFEYYEKLAKERQKEHGKTAPGKRGNTPGTITGSVSADARDQAGKAVGVCGSLIDRARVVKEKGVPELAEAVEQGRMSVSRAAKVARCDESKQREEASAATFSKGRFRKKEHRQAMESDNRPELEEGEARGVGVIRANEAINSLKRIPKGDALRERAFQIVTDWIKSNR